MAPNALQGRLVCLDRESGVSGAGGAWDTTGARSRAQVWVLVLDLGIVTVVLVVEVILIALNEDHVQLGGNPAGPPLLRPVRGDTGLKITAVSRRLGAQ